MKSSLLGKTTFLLWVILVPSVWAKGESEALISRVFPGVPSKSRLSMVNYLQAADFSFCQVNPTAALKYRQEWRLVGKGCVPELLLALQRNSFSEKIAVVSLLAGTNDPRATSALKNFVKTERKEEARWAAYAALAELGNSPAYYSNLLLQEVRKGQREPDGERTWKASLFLAQIHHRDAVRAQDQLFKEKLVDGALAEMVYPLLKFRDYELAQAGNR